VVIGGDDGTRSAELAAELSAAVQECARQPSASLDLWVRPYAGVQGTALQVLVMLKPELTNSPPAVARVLAMLTAHGVQLAGARVLSSAFVTEHQVLRHQYGTLSRVSHEGLPAVPVAAADRLFEQFPEVRDARHRVAGGHEFLGLVPDFSAFSLEVLTRNTPVVKLGAGVYAIRVLIDGDLWVLLNPFHPCQVEHFTTPGQAIVVLEAHSHRPLPELRATTIGATDPQDAVAGSIKRTLLDDQAELGLTQVCTRRNCVHISPSAVEAMASLRRYFSTPADVLPVERTVFGARLCAAGFSAAEITTLADNPQVDLLGRRGPLFEVTEDMDVSSALEFTATLLAARREVVW
jgi:nucleoside diphosphate kinase